MQILKHIATSFVDSGGVLSLSASGMVATFSIVYQVPMQLSLLLIAFFVAFFSYYINRIAEINEDRLTHPHRTRFVEENKWEKTPMLKKIFRLFLNDDVKGLLDYLLSQKNMG